MKDVLMKKKWIYFDWRRKRNASIVKKGKEADLWKKKVKENIQYKPGKMKIEW